MRCATSLNITQNLHMVTHKPSTALSLSTLRRRHSVHTPVLLTPSAPDYTGTWLNNKFLQCPINSSDSVMRATLPAHGLGGFIVVLLSSCTLTRSSTAFISQQFPFTLKHLRRGDPEISGVLDVFSNSSTQAIAHVMQARLKGHHCNPLLPNGHH